MTIVLWILSAVMLLIVICFVILFCVTATLVGRSRAPMPESADDARAKGRRKSFVLQGIEGMERAKTLPCEEVFIRSSDGLPLKAYHYRCADPSTNKLVIALHGWHGWAPFALDRFLGLYRSLGCDALLVCQRAHYGSGGKHITFGVKESSDALLWCRKAVEMYGEDVSILLHGVSMGAATLDMAASSEEVPPQVKGLVSDCAYSSLKRLTAGVMHIPDLPSKLCLPAIRLSGRILTGVDLYEAEPVKTISKVRVPVLFIHGADDTFVPASMARELYDACTSPKEIFLVEGAWHASSYATDTEGYERRFREFAGRCI